MPINNMPNIDRFLSKVKKPRLKGECWIWIGWLHRGRKHKDYGLINYKGKILFAHRIAYQFAHPDEDITDFEICHHCDNPPCVNPEHLFKGTHKDNMVDMQKLLKEYRAKKKK